MASLESLLELRALLDVLESQYAPESSGLRVESMKTGFEFTEDSSCPAGGQQAAMMSPDNSSTAQYGRCHRGSPSADEDDPPDLVFSTT